MLDASSPPEFAPGGFAGWGKPGAVPDFPIVKGPVYFIESQDDWMRPATSAASAPPT